LQLRLVLASIVIAAAASPAALGAQRADSTRAGVAAPVVAAAAASRAEGPSPRRAFLGSLLLPGSMQLRFDRPKAATIFLLAEAGALGMSVKSWSDLSKAKDARADTVGTPVLNSDGTPQIDPQTGEPVITYAPRNKNLADRVRARRAHLEDWLAVLVFNHLFAGADAFVSANLADFDDNVGTTSGHRRMEIRARVAW
jgi:hypothetical protein